MFRKLLVFGFCFLTGFLFRPPCGYFSLVDREAVVAAEAQVRAIQRPKICLPTADGVQESRQLKKLKRQYDSVIERRQRLIRENLEMPLITETERYANLEWKLYELQKKIGKQLVKENKTLVDKQICSEF